jgi:hypothetical protein
MLHLHNFLTLRRRNDLDVTLIAVEFASRKLLLKHLIELKIASAFHLGEAEVKVDAARHRQGKEDEGDFGAQIGIGGVDQK